MGSLLFRMLIAVEFSSIWIDLGWRKPVAEWFIAHGCGRIAGYWGVMWVNMPQLLLSFIVGLLSGLLLRSRWFLAAGVSCLGFFMIPEIMGALYMWTEGVYPLPFISTCVAIIGLLFDVANITLLFVGARFGAHFIGKRERV